MSEARGGRYGRSARSKPAKPQHGARRGRTAARVLAAPSVVLSYVLRDVTRYTVTGMTKGRGRVQNTDARLTLTPVATCERAGFGCSLFLPGAGRPDSRKTRDWACSGLPTCY